MVREADFNKVYGEYHSKILRYIARLTNDNETEDITQEVFEKVNRPGFKGKSQLSTWIYRIATNAALDRMRSPSFRRPGEDIADGEQDRDVWTRHKKPSVDHQLIRKEMSECVQSI